MIFQDLHLWWLFLLLPILAAAIYWGYLHKKLLLSRFVDFSLFEHIDLKINYTAKFWKKVLFLAALFFIMLAILRPQYGFKKEQISRKGQEIIIALDTSLSMAAEDIKPSRFEKAKQEIRSLLESLKGDKVGLIVFSGSAAVQCPFTLDYACMQMFVDDLQIGQISRPGTNLEVPIATAIEKFSSGKKNVKYLIIFTDGESFHGDPIAAAIEAKKHNIKILTVGLGAENPEPIPLKNQQGQLLKYKKDAENNLVLSKLNQDILKQLASETDGKFYLANNQNFASLDLYKDLLQVEKQTFRQTISQEAIDRYYVFLFIAFVLLIIEMLIPGHGSRNKKWHGRL